MKRNVLTYINKLQAYKTAIKNLHWSSKNMSEHKLWDDIADSLADAQDEMAEISQGLFGRIKLNELKPRRYNITNSKKTLNDIIKDTKMFYSTIKRSNDYIGLRSVVENFLAELDKFTYLMDFCIKEDIKRNIKESLNENKYKTPYHRLQAALNVKGVSNDKRHEEINNFFAKSQALKDINADIAKDNEINPHNRQFNKPFNLNTFDTDFNVLDNDELYGIRDYDPSEIKTDHSVIEPRTVTNYNLPDRNFLTANGQYIRDFDDDSIYRDNKEKGKYLESKHQNLHKIKLTENQLRNLINEALQNVLTDDRKQDEIDASWDAWENTRQPVSKYDIKGNLQTNLDADQDWYKMGRDNYAELIDTDMDDFLDDYYQFAKYDDGFNGMQAQKSEPFYKTYYQDRYDKQRQKRKLENYR